MLVLVLEVTAALMEANLNRCTESKESKTYTGSRDTSECGETCESVESCQESERLTSRSHESMLVIQNPNFIAEPHVDHQHDEFINTCTVY